MKTLSVWLVLSGLLMLAMPALAADTNTTPALIIYVTGGMGGAGPQVCVALWRDGSMVWSSNSIEGGPPFRQGTFPKEKLTSLMQKLKSEGAFTNQALRRAWFGPDSRFTVIVAEDGGRKLRLQSWHELFEQRTNLVATSGGITDLHGENRAAVLQAQPEDYREFRRIWSEIRAAITALVPTESKPFKGTIPIPQG